jgi:hypothetical protein
MKDEIVLYLSPQTTNIVKLLHKHKNSEKALLAAHPELTRLDLAAAVEEVMRAVEAMNNTAPAPKASRKSKRKSAPSGDAFQIKITLRGSKPPIWRRVVVPVEIRLNQLHDVIQAVMGWYDGHLHAFEIAGEEFQGRGTDGYWDEDSGALDEANYRLGDLVSGAKDKFSYVYDFGDDWNHTLAIEKVIPASDHPPTMTCLAGKNRGPLEDSGGLWGYYDKLRIMADPNDPQHEEVAEWMDLIDPTEFDLEEVNKRLEKLK